MAVQRRTTVLALQSAWMLALGFALAVSNAVSYELFFVLSVVGFSIVVDLVRPVAIRPRWWDRIRAVLAVGLSGFAIVAAWRLAELLGPGLPL